MDMRAHLLASLGGAKDSDHRHRGFLVGLRDAYVAAQLRIEPGGYGLVVIDAIQPHSEEIHGKGDRAGGHKVSGPRVHHHQT